MKVFQSYLIFYVIDEEEAVITILRVLQERQNWKNILEQWIRNDSFILF
ncbi:MAG: type II toxin-antitoxin system RelE/ParE family toxin [Lachnospiraceae bacterium]|nr:type II toxin-antitoxin system RelE/ParE family toxin [Lachnospiraceae bacterium]